MAELAFQSPEVVGQCHTPFDIVLGSNTVVDDDRFAIVTAPPLASDSLTLVEVSRLLVSFRSVDALSLVNCLRPSVNLDRFEFRE
ncbi:hypothetical protein ACFQMM_22335 [Saliphagus sp. GCM10025308]